MSTILRLLTISFMISMLAAGIAGYAGTRAAGAPISIAIEELRDSCAAMVQSIKVLADDLQQPAMSPCYYSAIAFPYPVARPPETLRLF